jgi:hypothetical protein
MTIRFTSLICLVFTCDSILQYKIPLGFRALFLFTYGK